MIYLDAMRQALPFFLIMSLLMVFGCSLLPNMQLRLGATALLTFLSIAIAVIWIMSSKKSEE